MASKLLELRKGIPPHKLVTLNGGLNVMVVVLPSDTIQQCEMETEKYANEHKDTINDNVKNQYFDMMLCYHCMRDPDDSTFTTKVADSPDEVGQVMDIEDISRVTSAYSELMLNKAPKIGLLTEEDYQDIKKYLGETQLNDLNTVSHVHLANFHQSLALEK